MKSKTIIWVIGLAMLSLPVRGQGPDQTSVAVYQIRPTGSADKSLGPALTSLLSSKLTVSPRLRVVEEAMLKTVMERQAMNASDVCDDTVCQVEIGKLVQAQKIIAGDLVKLGSKYILSLKLIDVQSGTTEFACKETCPCTEDQLDQLVEVAATKIRNHFGEALPMPDLPQAPGAQPVHSSSPANPVPANPDPNGESLLYVYLASFEGYAGYKPGLTVFIDGKGAGSLSSTLRCLKKKVGAGDHVVNIGSVLAKKNEYKFNSALGEKIYLTISDKASMRTGAVETYNRASEAEAKTWLSSCP